MAGGGTASIVSAAHPCGSKGGQTMSSIELRRKLRNFPTAKLAPRIAR
jgi:hypothetical protein